MHREQSRRRSLRGCCVAGAGALAAGGVATGATAAETEQAAPETRWDRTYAEGTNARVEAVAPADDGFVVVGTNEPADGDNESEIWLAKLSEAGQLVWERTFAERAVTEGFDVAATDDGFVVAGHTREEGADAQNALALRVDAEGVEQWRRDFYVRPGTTDTMRAVAVDGEGRFVFAGWAIRFDDAWVARLTDDNAIDWAKRYGPGSRSRYHGVVTDSDGGYIVVGETDDTSGDTAGWANKLDEEGAQQFKKRSESSTNPYDDYNAFYDVAETRNGFRRGRQRVRSEDERAARLGAGVQRQRRQALGQALHRGQLHRAARRHVPGPAVLRRRRDGHQRGRRRLARLRRRPRDRRPDAMVGNLGRRFQPVLRIPPDRRGRPRHRRGSG